MTRLLEDPDGEGESTPVGLCRRCLHGRPIENDRGSAFWLCRRSRIDPTFPRYPGLPVRRCDGFEPATPADRD